MTKHKTLAACIILLGVGAYAVQFELYNSTDAAASLNPSAKTSATNNGSAVDLKGYGSALVIVPVGAWTDGSHQIEIEESATGSGSWATPAAADIVGATVLVNDANDDNAVYQFGYIGDERYIRVSGYVSSATTGAVYGGLVLRGHPITEPTN